MLWYIVTQICQEEEMVFQLHGNWLSYTVSDFLHKKNSAIARRFKLNSRYTSVPIFVCFYMTTNTC